MAPTSFGQLLRQHRRAAGLTQEHIAERAGLSVHGIQKLEQGLTLPYRDTLRRLLDVLELAPDDQRSFEAAARPRPRQQGRAARSSVSSGRHNLPAQATPFIGRQPELADIVRLLAKPACRLLTLVGPGGIGKTRVAIEAGHQQLDAFADGVLFVPLAPVESPHMLASAIASALSVSLSGPQSASAQLVHYLQEKQQLLVLDNFEHLLGGTELLTELLGAPGVKLLITSRERLNLQQEWVFEIAGLPFPVGQPTVALEEYAAVELFVQRAQQVRATFSLADNAQAVIGICQRVEGMPLGLELAATWLRVMPCQEIAPRIAHGLDFLTTAVRNMPERHRSLRVVMEHSWDLLSEVERRVLARLSVFRGGFALQAADEVAGASLSVLASLADKSLVRVNTSGRYDLHELLRQYLTDKLAVYGETANVTGRHLDFYSIFAQDAEAHQYGPQQEAWFDLLEIEHDNLRAALAWSLRDAQIEAGMRVASALGFFWELRSHWYDGYEWLKRLVDEHPNDASALVRAKALRFAAVFANYANDQPRPRVWAEESLRLARESDDPCSTGWALCTLGFYVEGDSNPKRAVALLDEALALFRQIGDAWGISHALRRLGIRLTADGDFERARLLLEEALAGARAVGDGNALAWSLLLLGNVVWLQTGDAQRATARFDEALSLSPHIRDWGNHIWLLFMLGAAARAQGNYAHARARYEQVVRLMQDRQVSVHLNWPELLCGALAGLGGLALAQGKPVQAARLFGATSHLPGPPTGFYRVDRERDAAAARDLLGDAAFAAAFSDGQALTSDQAIALALQGPGGRRRAQVRRVSP